MASISAVLPEGQLLGPTFARFGKRFRMAQGLVGQQPQGAISPIMSPTQMESEAQAQPFQPSVLASDIPGDSAYDKLALNEFAQQNALGQNQAGQISDYYRNVFQPGAQGLQTQLGDYAKQNQADIQGFGTQYGQNAANYRNQLAQNLLGFGQQQFQEATPGLLEDLNRRGLLSSPTEVANATTQALKDINLANQPTLMNFDTDVFNRQQDISSDALNAGMAARDPELAKQLFGQGQNIQQEALSSRLGGESAALQGALDLQRQKMGAEFQRQSQEAEQALAERLAKKEGRNQMTNALIGAGGSLLGGVLGGGGGGGLLGGLFGGGGAAAGGGGGGLLGGLFGGGGAAAGGAAGAGGALGGAGSILGPAAGAAALTGLGIYGGQKLGNAIFKSKAAEKRARTGATIGGLVGMPFAGAALGGLTKSHVAGQISKQAKNLISQPGKTIANAPKNVVKSVSNVAKKVFCFHPYTDIEMADGTTKQIHLLEIGDATKGGFVESIRKSMTPDKTLYDYQGVLVTGSHAVKEDGIWKRVKDSVYAHLVRGARLVYSVVTDKHRVFSNGIEFADEHETDDYENLTMDQSLRALNSGALMRVV